MTLSLVIVTTAAYTTFRIADTPSQVRGDEMVDLENVIQQPLVPISGACGRRRDNSRNLE
jgi:hypothetical protein